MRVFGLPRVFYDTMARHSPPQPSHQAQERLRWLSAWEALLKGGLSTGEASEALGISRASLYRWRSRLKTQDPRTGEGLIGVLSLSWQRSPSQREGSGNSIRGGVRINCWFCSFARASGYPHLW